MKQKDQRGADTILHPGEKDTGAAINPNKLKIDFEFPPTESKNSSKSKTKFEIKNIFNLNSNAGKLNEESYLISRLYIAISILKKYLRGFFRIDNKSNFINIKKRRFHRIKD
jgi:hypothetical protein